MRSGHKVVFWQDYTTHSIDDAVSIPQLVEQNADTLRACYLSWIYKLGQTQVGGKKMVDCLEIRPGLSYWWLTLLAEKCNWAKSPLIEDAIRLFAFTRFIRRRRIDRIKFVSANSELADSIHLWCKKRKIVFEWKKISENLSGISLQRIMCSTLPQPVQALGWLLRYVGQRIRLKSTGLRQWQESPGDILFVSYLLNLQPKETQKGKYACNYWGTWPKFLFKKNYKTRWLHHYIPHSLLPDAKKASDALNKINRSAKGKQIHVALDAFFSLRLILRVLRDWFRIIIYGCQFDEGLRRSFGYLAPLFIKDWHKSCFGIPAIKNLLHLNLFEKAMKTLPNQRVGFYLQENQPWEVAFIHAWEKAGHGKLVGVPHSSVRFWDLRYFYDPRSYKRAGHNDLPMPDQVALNGSAMMREYQKSGYPSSQILKVEALRYLHITTSSSQIKSIKNKVHKQLKVLVLGDYLARNTHQMMLFLEKVVKLPPKNLILVVKPHPNCPIRPTDYPGLKMKIKTEPIHSLLVDCDVAYTSAVTSAALDAYCAGVPVVSVRDRKTLNLSPLRNSKGVHFISTPEELKEALNKVKRRNKRIKIKKSFFYVNKNIPRWKKILISSK